MWEWVFFHCTCSSRGWRDECQEHSVSMKVVHEVGADCRDFPGSFLKSAHSTGIVSGWTPGELYFQAFLSGWAKQQRWGEFSNMKTASAAVRIYLPSSLWGIIQLPLDFSDNALVPPHPITHCLMLSVWCTPPWAVVLNPHVLSLIQFSLPWSATKSWLISLPWPCAIGSVYLPPVNENKR